MANKDKYTLPKHIKVEKDGEPRGIRRGFKKGERKKGKKARIDEILSALRYTKQYALYIIMERQRKAERPEWYRPFKNHIVYEPGYEKWFDDSKLKLDLLIAKAIKDKVIMPEDVVKFCVQKP